MNKVAIYIRVSTSYQVDKDSLPMQRSDLISYAKLMLNTEDYVIFEDAGYSGKNTLRPKYQEMLSMLRSGCFTHLLVWKIDRISRNLLDFSSLYKELKELGVTFVSKQEQFDTSTAMGEAMLKIILVFAELERNMTSERVTATMISRANNGIWNGGRVPYGYSYSVIDDEQVFSIVPEEAEIVERIHFLYEEHHSICYVARILNSKGLRTREGNPWSVSAIHIILSSIFYVGDYRYNVLKEGDRQKKKPESEWVTVTDHHPAIIDRKQKNRIISMLDDNRRCRKEYHSNSKTSYTHVFGRLIICGECNSYMTNSTAYKKDWNYSNYRCPNRMRGSCANKGTSDPKVGEFIINLILNILNALPSFSSSSDVDLLGSAILKGNTFSDIDHIDNEGLLQLIEVFKCGDIAPSIFGKPEKAKKRSSSKNSLASKRTNLVRALDRLQDLYLYSDTAMSERDYLIKRSEIEEQIADIDEQIAADDGFDNAMSDQDFIRRASEFVIAQKLKNRNYINYMNLAKSVDQEVLKNFFSSVIDNICLLHGRIVSVTFKNGVYLSFIYKKDPA